MYKQPELDSSPAPGQMYRWKSLMSQWSKPRTNQTPARTQYTVYLHGQAYREKSPQKQEFNCQQAVWTLSSRRKSPDCSVVTAAQL